MLSPTNTISGKPPIAPGIHCSRRDFLNHTATLAAASFLCSFLKPCDSSALSITAKNNPSDMPNVLFIAVDDLRMAAMGAYGVTQVKTPNIDAFAKDAVVFEQAYCQYPICMPSRASLMCSMREVGNRADSGPSAGATTLGQHFKDHGYYTMANGKIYHTVTDSADSWSEAPWRVYDYEFETEGDWADYHFSKIWLDPASADNRNERGRGPFWEAADVPDEAYEDGQVVEKSLGDLHRLTEKDQPFFLAVGLHRPHLPFNAPKRYFNLYDPETIDLAVNRFPIEYKPEECTNSGEITQYTSIAGWPEDERFHREARHAYFACVSYVDALIGKLINALKALEIYDKTVVILWSDHGWLLGAHNFWGKHNTLNESIQVPLIVRAPDCKQGARCNALVELLDLYPTLNELAGLPAPESHTLEGKSFAALLKNPDKPWKEAVFSRWQQARVVKTERYLYTEWPSGSKMLFDHFNDPNENVNIADLPEYETVVRELSALIASVM